MQSWKEIYDSFTGASGQREPDGGQKEHGQTGGRKSNSGQPKQEQPGDRHSENGQPKQGKPGGRQPENGQPKHGQGAGDSSSGRRDRSPSAKARAGKPETFQLAASLDDNLRRLQDRFGDNGDWVTRRFLIRGRYAAAVVFFSSMTDVNVLNEHVLQPLMSSPDNGTALPGPGCKQTPYSDAPPLPDHILDTAVELTQGQVVTEGSKIESGLPEGLVALLIDGRQEALTLDLRKSEKRGIEQPQTEQVIRGAREGFIEALETNLSLLRRRIQSPELRIVMAPIGRRTRSRVALCYMSEIADPKLVAEVMRRLSSIDIEGVIDSGYLEQFIEDEPLSPFPQIQNTERPDKTAAALLEGRVALLVDGSPFCLIMPGLFNEFFQTVDDYSERFIIAGLIRFIRLAALMFSLFFPSIYVSVISFNPELIPTEFAVAVSGGRAGVPLPAVLEVLIMEISMEVLREATIRLPQMVGGALSIVGVLVIGQAAVSAGLSSPVTVVIVALTTIGSFATPAYNAAIALRMLRFPLILMAGIFGLYGVMIGTLLIFNHLLYLESFGVPYMTPFVAGKWYDFKDTLIRAPLWSLRRRPSYLQDQDGKRLPDSVSRRFERRIFGRGETDE